MKFSYQWLRELVEALDASPADLARLITLKTAECEGVEQHGSDHIIEVDNKSLTHRPDLWGHHGMAREIAAIARKKLLDPVKVRPVPGDPAIGVEIADFALSPRYSALVFENVAVKPSPAWLAQRLESVGLNAINNIVDVTNYVMAEIAQPMHAFDADKLRGGAIFVRTAQAGEEIAALNDETYSLDASNLVIADAQGAIAIAGVIGGAGSAISDTTTRIVLESANFNAASVRKTSARIKLRTDASMRFEKAQDPLNTVRGLQRAWELLEQVSPGIRLIGGLADAYRPAPESGPIVLPLDWLDRKLGRAVPPEEVRAILEALEFRVEDLGDRRFSVSVPSWRATKDVSIKEDLAEEVGRMVGFDSITPVAPLSPARAPHASPSRLFHRCVREIAAKQGFTEVYNYSFISDDQARTFGFDPASHLHVANPIASGQNLLRRSLLPLILKNIHDNIRNFDQFRFFEIGREILPEREISHLAAAVYSKDDDAAPLFELKHLAECLVPGVVVRPSRETQSYEHPYRAAILDLAEAAVGRLFEFHPRMIESGRGAVMDLDLELLEKLQPASVRYQPLRRFPVSAFDLSIVAPPRSLAGDVQNRLQRLAGDALLSIVFLRDFALPTGQRSLSYRLTVGASDRTLSSEEVAVIRERVIEGMRQTGFELKV